MGGNTEHAAGPESGRWKSETDIQVTRTYMPPASEYQAYLTEIWERGWVTNHGPLVTGLEEKLREILDVPHLYFLSNGTVALQIAIKALGLSGEIITSPFSYVATTSSIVWENCRPVFADIEPDAFTLDAEKAEAAITPQTTAILATHVFGNPCDVEGLQDVADRHGIHLIYDAAHAYGVEYKGRGLFRYGDISTLSCHATKLFHTIEGGAIATMDEDLAHKMAYMRNFGHNGQEAFWGLGINGKNSEFHAAMGHCMLPRMQEIISNREKTDARYRSLLEGVADRLTYQKIRPGTTYNYAYFPVVFDTEEELLNVKDNMNAANIFPRRYFYPCLSALDYVEGGKQAPLSGDLSKRVLCLPYHSELGQDLQENIVKLLVEAL